MTMRNEADVLAVLEAVREAQQVLNAHILPNGPDCAVTIDKLFGILDDHRLVSALEAAHPEGRTMGRMTQDALE